NAERLELDVALDGPAVETESILEPRAAAALDRHAQDVDVRFLRHQLLDLLRRGGCNRKQRGRLDAFLKLHFSSIVPQHPEVRVRRLHRAAAPAALHDQLLLDGDALHRLRHRDRLPVSARGHPALPRLVRIHRVPVLRRHPRRRVRVRVAEGRARVAIERLRDHGLQSERLLMPTKGPGVFENEVAAMEQAVGLTTLEKAVAWAQTKSMWPDTFGLACCAIEMMSIVSSRYDIARFGMEAFRSSPRQADLLIVSGRVVHKMAAPLRQVYDQMLEPKWVIAMGAW